METPLFDSRHLLRCQSKRHQFPPKNFQRILLPICIHSEAAIELATSLNCPLKPSFSFPFRCYFKRLERLSHLSILIQNVIFVWSLFIGISFHSTVPRDVDKTVSTCNWIDRKPEGGNLSHSSATNQPRVCRPTCKVAVESVCRWMTVFSFAVACAASVHIKDSDLHCLRQWPFCTP